MILSYKNFETKYLDSCMEMIKDTWLFEEDFINPKKPEYIYKHYVMSCVNWSEHLDLLVDENDKAVGILFGSIENTTWVKELKFNFIQFKLHLSMLWHILIGDLGERKRALAVYKKMKQHDIEGESNGYEFDSEINLFILSSSLRGQGYGSKLMNRYVEFCKKNDLDKAFLWTTTDCSWQFYERYGFKELRRFDFESADKDASSTNTNGIVFYLNIYN